MRNRRSIQRQRGFTLIEVIMVMVILGIIGSIGSHFVVVAVESYRTTELRQKLSQRARVTAEQLSRELRAALPNAVRTSSSGNCIEFLPVRSGTRYNDALPTPDNGKPAVTAVATNGFPAPPAAAQYLAVAPFFADEVYSASSPVVIAPLANPGGAVGNPLALAGSFTFVRNSTQRRAFLAGSPVRFCVVDNTLVRHANYGLPSTPLNDSAPAGESALMAHQVAAIGRAFVLSPGSQDRNAAVHINLRFTSGGQGLDIKHKVAVRNVP